MLTQRNEDREARSILASYCSEFERLAATLADLLDVARRGSTAPADTDARALKALAPLLDRLTSHVGSIEVSRAPQGGVFGRSGGSQVRSDSGRVADMCRPAVEASVNRILSGRSADVDLSYTLRDGPGNFGAAEGLEEVRQLETRALARAAEREEERVAGEQPVRARVEPDDLFDVLMGEVSARVTLQGTSASLPIPSLFELIAGASKSGVLHLRTPDEHLQFEFDDGSVVSTATDAMPPGQRLGDMVIELGFVSAGDLDDAVARAAEASRPLGAALVDLGLLTVEQLRESLHAQVQARFDRVFREDLVAYAFAPESVEEGDGHLRMNARELMLQSARRIDEDERDDEG